MRDTTLGDEIKRRRKSQGVTQEELAEKLEVSRKTISDWESGKAEPKDENLEAIERHMGLTPQRAYELLGRIPDADRTAVETIIRQAESERDWDALFLLWRRLGPGAQRAIRRLAAAGLVEGSEREQVAGEE